MSMTKARALMAGVVVTAIQASILFGSHSVTEAAQASGKDAGVGLAAGQQGLSDNELIAALAQLEDAATAPTASVVDRLQAIAQIGQIAAMGFAPKLAADESGPRAQAVRLLILLLAYNRADRWRVSSYAASDALFGASANTVPLLLKYLDTGDNEIEQGQLQFAIPSGSSATSRTVRVSDAIVAARLVGAMAAYASQLAPADSESLQRFKDILSVCERIIGSSWPLLVKQAAANGLIAQTAAARAAMSPVGPTLGTEAEAPVLSTLYEVASRPNASAIRAAAAQALANEATARGLEQASIPDLLEMLGMLADPELSSDLSDLFVLRQAVIGLTNFLPDPTKSGDLFMGALPSAEDAKADRLRTYLVEVLAKVAATPLGGDLVIQNQAMNGLMRLTQSKQPLTAATQNALGSRLDRLAHSLSGDLKAEVRQGLINLAAMAQTKPAAPAPAGPAPTTPAPTVPAPTTPAPTTPAPTAAAPTAPAPTTAGGSPTDLESLANASTNPPIVVPFFVAEDVDTVNSAATLATSAFSAAQVPAVSTITVVTTGPTPRTSDAERRPPPNAGIPANQLPGLRGQTPLPQNQQAGRRVMRTDFVTNGFRSITIAPIKFDNVFDQPSQAGAAPAPGAAGAKGAGLVAPASSN